LVNELIENNERAGQTFNKTWVKAKLFKTKLQQRQQHFLNNEQQATSNELPATSSILDLTFPPLFRILSPLTRQRSQPCRFSYLRPHLVISSVRTTTSFCRGRSFFIFSKISQIMGGISFGLSSNLFMSQA
jgi:hypothetical protein